MPVKVEPKKEWYTMYYHVSGSLKSMYLSRTCYCVYRDGKVMGKFRSKKRAWEMKVHLEENE